MNRKTIDSLLTNRHARKDMLNGLFRKYFTTPATIRCELEDHVIHLSPHDSTLTPAILEKGHWNRHELERGIDVLRSCGALGENGLFLDVGANIGTQTIYALRSGAFREVHAFEPEPENARLFDMNMEANGLQDRVRLSRQAVGAEEGSAKLQRHPRNAGAHSLTSGDLPAADGDVLPVSMTSLDRYLDQIGVAAEKVSMVWIDVEGGEPGVVAGAGRLMQARVPIVLEFLARDREREDFVDMFAVMRSTYTHVCCLQDAARTRLDISSLTTDLPEGDYLVFSTHD